MNGGKGKSSDDRRKPYAADVTWRSSSFQTRTAATGKARSPTVDNRVRRTISDGDDAERRRPRASKSVDRRNSSEHMFMRPVT